MCAIALLHDKCIASMCLPCGWPVCMNLSVYAYLLYVPEQWCKNHLLHCHWSLDWFHCLRHWVKWRSWSCITATVRLYWVWFWGLGSHTSESVLKMINIYISWQDGGLWVSGKIRFYQPHAASLETRWGSPVVLHLRSTLLLLTYTKLFNKILS